MRGLRDCPTGVLRRVRVEEPHRERHQAQPAPIDAIHPGDQLRARGEKNPDGTEITAEEVVSGSFRSIAGTISSIDAPSSILVVKDLATKKPVTIHITVDSGSTTFSVLLPNVNLPTGPFGSANITTEGITTLHKFSIFQVQGQTEFYTVVPMHGAARHVLFEAAA